MTAVRQITGPASPVMRAGVAEAGRGDCRLEFDGRGWGFW